MQWATVARVTTTCAAVALLRGGAGCAADTLGDALVATVTDWLLFDERNVCRQVEIEIKYEGYIKKQLREIERFKNLEMVKIPADLNFSGIHGLSNELKEKLTSIKPTSLGQVSRIEGITPAAISVLMVALKAGAGRIEDC